MRPGPLRRPSCRWSRSVVGPSLPTVHLLAWLRGRQPCRLPASSASTSIPHVQHVEPKPTDVERSRGNVVTSCCHQGCFVVTRADFTEPRKRKSPAVAGLFLERDTGIEPATSSLGMCLEALEVAQDCRVCRWLCATWRCRKAADSAVCDPRVTPAPLGVTVSNSRCLLRAWPAITLRPPRCR